jgi:hypothetical protein
MYKNVPLVPFLSHMNLLHILPPYHPLFWTYVYLLVCNKVVSVACFPSDIPTRSLYQFFVSQMHVTCHAYLIVFDFIIFIWLSSSLDPIRAVFSNLLLVYPCKVHIISPLSCLQTPSVCVSSLMWQTNLPTHKKQAKEIKNLLTVLTSWNLKFLHYDLCVLTMQ